MDLLLKKLEEINRSEDSVKKYNLLKNINSYFRDFKERHILKEIEKIDNIFFLFEELLITDYYESVYSKLLKYVKFYGFRELKGSYGFSKEYKKVFISLDPNYKEEYWGVDLLINEGEYLFKFRLKKGEQIFNFLKNHRFIINKIIELIKELEFYSKFKTNSFFKKDVLKKEFPKNIIFEKEFDCEKALIHMKGYCLNIAVKGDEPFCFSRFYPFFINEKDIGEIYFKAKTIKDIKKNVSIFNKLAEVFDGIYSI